MTDAYPTHPQVPVAPLPDVPQTSPALGGPSDYAESGTGQAQHIAQEIDAVAQEATQQAADAAPTVARARRERPKVTPTRLRQVVAKLEASAKAGAAADAQLTELVGGVDVSRSTILAAVANAQEQLRQGDAPTAKAALAQLADELDI